MLSDHRRAWLQLSEVRAGTRDARREKGGMKKKEEWSGKERDVRGEVRRGNKR